MAAYPKLVNKQFNSPINLYSAQNVQETLNKQTQLLANGAVGIDFLHNPATDKPGNLANSAVLRMLEEEEERQRKGQAPSLKRVAWPPPADSDYQQQQQQQQQSTGTPVIEQQPIFAQGGPNYHTTSTSPNPLSRVHHQQQPSSQQNGHHQQQQPAQYQQQQPTSQPKPHYQKPNQNQPHQAAVNRLIYQGAPAPTSPLKLPQQVLNKPAVGPQSPLSPLVFSSTPFQHQPQCTPPSSPGVRNLSPRPFSPAALAAARGAPGYGATSPGRLVQQHKQAVSPRGWAPVQPPVATQSYAAPQQAYHPQQQQQQQQPPHQVPVQVVQTQQPTNQSTNQPTNYQSSNAPAQQQQYQPQPTQAFRPVAHQQQAPPATTIQLRQEAPVSQEPNPVYTSQPATATLQGGSNMRGDQKWPPAEVKAAVAAENQARVQLAKGPACRPRKVKKDYSQFFAQHALNCTYPGYRAPPGTQHYDDNTGMSSL